MEEEVILNKIIEEAQNEANLIIARAQETAKKIEEENSNKAAKEAQDQFEIVRAKITKNSVSEIEKVEFEARSAELVERKRIIEIVKEKVKQKIKDLKENIILQPVIVGGRRNRKTLEYGIKLGKIKACEELLQESEGK